MGICIPLISNISPIRSAIGTSLRDALDIFRKKVDDFTLQMTKLHNFGISPIQMLLGSIFTAFGFVVYYFIPMSILTKNMNLFFFLIMGVLFLLIIGLTLIA